MDTIARASMILATVSLVGCTGSVAGGGGSGGGASGQGGATSAAHGPSATNTAANGTGVTAGNGATGATTVASATTGAGPATTSTSSGGNTAYAQHCVDQINQYRATLGLPAYARWDTAEPCADQQSQSDGNSNTAHGAFQMCGEWAQNECPGWPGTPSSIIDGCLMQMWAEGPGAFNQGHGHYINMSSTQYTKVACGAYQFPDGTVWAVQDFQ
jgi:hypothetical protein